MPDSTFGFEKPEQSAGFLLWQTTTIWQRLIREALEPYNIIHPQFVVMAILLWFREHNQETNQITIANWSKLDKMTVSRSLKKLADSGFVVRSEHDKDPRAKSVQLTDAGCAFIKTLVPIIENIDAQFFGRLTSTNEQCLVAILDTLTGFSHENSK
ncbi:MAG: MarR family transcriptional regulator, organic hydroperoxide resistance regulator [Candidatus Dependentiae bacterium]|nr:MarR family transcriptional regulator, organic hydroperoxide resistance regulator [Candidatus Dependentiae bacterium]